MSEIVGFIAFKKRIAVADNLPASGDAPQAVEIKNGNATKAAILRRSLAPVSTPPSPDMVWR